MASQALSSLRAEVQAAKDLLLPQLEGMRDFSRLNLAEKSHEAVKHAIETYERRLLRLDVVLEQLELLEGDGYPERPARQVFKEQFNDIADNVRTIQAAFSQFATIEEPVTGDIVFGEPVPRNEGE